jgi:hypothetical protein
VKHGTVLVASLLPSMVMLSAADSQKPTEVIVIGTVHSPTPKFNADHLERILEQLKPAAILFEVDSSFIDPRTGRLTLSGTLEGYAVKAYVAKSDVPVLPYDIERRNKIYADHHYFELERDFMATVRTLYQQNILQPVSKVLYAEVLAHFSARDGCGREGPEVINSAKCDEIEQRKLDKTFPNFKKIIALVRDFENESTHRASPYRSRFDDPIQSAGVHRWRGIGSPAANLECTEVLVPITVRHCGLGLDPKPKLVEVRDTDRPIPHPFDYVSAYRDW